MKTNSSKKSRRHDRLAEWFIRIGGILVIVAVVWILVMIARVAMPLFYPSHADISSSCSLPSQLKDIKVVASGSDDSRQQVFLLDDSGSFHCIEASSGRLMETIKVPSIPKGATRILSTDPFGKSTYNLLWNNDAVSSITIAFTASSDTSAKPSVSAALTANDDLFFDGHGPVQRAFVRRIEDKGAMRVDQLANGHFAVLHRLVEKDLLDNESTKISTAKIEDKLPGTITAAILDQKGHYLYAGTDNGWVLRWDVSEPGAPRLIDTVAATGGIAVTSLNVALGDISLAIGDAHGGYAAWFPVTSAGSGQDKLLTRIHTFPNHKGAVVMIAPSFRNKSLLSLDAAGVLRIDHTTSERTLVTLPKGASPSRQATLSAQGTALTVLEASGAVTVWNLDIPHPEVSLGTLFGKIWYEGYDKPEYVWQSSSATDDFEPKMSLMPLLFGTIKATAFAMLFAIPLALCGALYTSQFMAPQLKSRIKPAVEIMAAIPSVVVGFLAGLWLAPLVDKSLLALFTTMAIVPALVFVFLMFWRKVTTASPLERLSRGKEFVILIPIILFGVYLSWHLSGLVEASFFSGDFKQWLYGSLGVRYDQRNCIIISIALGFAVIPIIFTIAEDAISNVPRNLTAASLALGASRWQTAWRVVLPSALPGVFSAVMIGFGRAIGETMIVLMATGNTPIMSWSVFNGLRSLSANIAVEIPEAPLDGSLYRVLFLSAVLLFIFTFIINTIAEALRQRFRKKYGRY
jgi:phosphate transport system permease protein